MKTGQVIIGANYGDEGKGLLTDYFASQNPSDSLVVRFNGGAQAGHTVQTPDGRRHVFSHFGSGSFANCPTYLSKFFIVNPLLFVKERQQLKQVGVAPSIYISGDSLLTTPFDMFINQTVERRRGAARHGSCGVGVNETVSRCLTSNLYKTTTDEIRDPLKLYFRLRELSTTWFPTRLEHHKIDLQLNEVQTFKANLENILQQYICDSVELSRLSEITDIYPDAQNIIFEGAQGLMLDEDRIDQFPNVTRSKTGLTNVLHLAPKFGLSRLQSTYVTRSYLTRHGAGPLPGESNWSVEDQTNVPNQFQGTLRFAPLDLQTLQHNIDMDLSRAKFNRKITVEGNLAVTCLDQVQLPFPIKTLDKNPVPISYFCYGPTRAEVQTAFNASVR